MRRCGKDVLHEPHHWEIETGCSSVDHNFCDGRTTNEGMVGQLTVRELREALDGEQDNALVTVNGRSIAIPSGSQKGQAVARFAFWTQNSYTCPKCGMTSYNPNDIREGYCGNYSDWTTPR